MTKSLVKLLEHIFVRVPRCFKWKHPSMAINNDHLGLGGNLRSRHSLRHLLRSKNSGIQDLPAVVLNHLQDRNNRNYFVVKLPINCNQQ